ncbi:lipoate protein ligase C-terminal domain-containing protein [Alcaligenes endophyticus]|uniref:Biotin--protein ligase n=1 Tax=Alcaligenes endophyticus TaxID=1929088 RepID=A0ABT8EI51_9BURK|nr:lipoate protein ligase C-terminal domain-containing protein [Alcaligenes endophyticus]MCX5592773.1 biotin--protein ligase [Alcaligenes endophyticus]MDN4120961.1 biotin--protein ligase [Alcaligenes endophyticus]
MHAEYKMPGGKLLVINLQVQAGRLQDVQLSGDFFLEPAEALASINQLLEGLPADCSEEYICHHLTQSLEGKVEMYGISPAAIAAVVRRALV